MKVRLRKRRSDLKQKFNNAIQQYCQENSALKTTDFEGAEYTMKFPWIIDGTGVMHLISYDIVL